MKFVALVLVLLSLAAPVLACRTEEDITTQLTTQFPDVTVKDRFEGLQAKKFMELFAQAVGKEPEEVAIIDLVLVFAKPDTRTYKLALFSDSCVVGSGQILAEFYPGFVEKLRLAMNF
jgi:hypothetical protein